MQGGSTTTTHYVGSIEKVWRPGGVIQVKRYLDGELIEPIEGSTRTVEYLLTDHLGSVDEAVNAAGSIVQSMAFDPFGRRRSPTNYAALAGSAIWSFDTTRTARGYTGHEQLDPVGLVHMNGLVYDPTLGRFLSPDPFVQDPSNTQSLNRYTYVFNNPLSYTDPSGYFSLEEAVGIAAAIVVSVYVGPWASGWVASSGGTFAAQRIVHGIAAGAITGAAASGASTLATGGSVGAAFRSAGYGALSGAAFGGIGGSELGTATHIAAHGMVGGVMAELQGGNFGHEFLSARLTKAANVNEIVGVDADLQGARLVAAALVGGTISEIAGGIFTNGAVRAALAQAMNGEVGASRHRNANDLGASAGNSRTSTLRCRVVRTGSDSDTAAYGRVAVRGIIFGFRIDRTG